MRFHIRPNIYRLGLKYPVFVLSLGILCTLLGYFYAKQLKIQTDFAALLPSKTQSVEGLHQYEDLFGNLGFLVITVQSQSQYNDQADDQDLTKIFAENLSTRIQKHPEVSYVIYPPPVDYFKKRGWLYLDLGDLKEMERRIDRSVELQKKGVSPVFSHLMDFADEADRPDLTFRDMFDKYEKRLKAYGGDVNPDAADRMALLWVKIKFPMGDIEASRKLIAEIKEMEKDLKKSGPYGPIQVGYTGSYETSIEEFDLTGREMEWVSLSVAVALFLILLVYFKKFSSVLLVSFPLVSGVIWTGALTYFIFGHVNVITGFAAAILGGLGSDYGIYLLSRFHKEKDAGVAFLPSCQLAFANTGRATFASMVTTVAAFGSLIFSQFGLFREFGVVGAIGLVMNYLAMMLFIPSILALTHRYHSQEKFGRLVRWNTLQWPQFSRGPHIIAKIFNTRRALVLIGITLLLCGLSALTLPSQARIYFEDGQMDTESLPGNKLYAKVSKVIGGTLNPTVLMIEGREEEKKIVEKLDAQVASGDNAIVFNRVLGLSTFIPNHESEKRTVLQRMIQKYTLASLVLKVEKQKVLESIHETLKAPPITRENLPREITRLFISPKDPRIHAVYLYPAFELVSSDQVKKYYAGIKAEQDSGSQFMPVDTSFILKDIINSIEKEAPRGLCFLLVFLSGVSLVSIRPFKRSVTILVHLLASLILLSAILWLSHIRLNVMNIAMLPIILGTGINCFIHFSHRYNEVGNVKDTISNYMMTILISNFTTIVGFGGLLFTSSVGIRSIGWVAVLGLVIVTLLCAFVFPRCLSLEAPQHEFTF